MLSHIFRPRPDNIDLRDLNAEQSVDRSGNAASSDLGSEHDLTSKPLIPDPPRLCSPHNVDVIVGQYWVADRASLFDQTVYFFDHGRLPSTVDGSNDCAGCADL